MNEREAEIKKRIEAATNGPWYKNVNDLIGGFCVGTIGAFASENMKSEDVADLLTEDNAEFIAHSREDVPYLLGRVERLEAALTEIRDRTKRDGDMADQAVNRLADAALADEEGTPRG